MNTDTNTDIAQSSNSDSRFEFSESIKYVDDFFIRLFLIAGHEEKDSRELANTFVLRILDATFKKFDFDKSEVYSLLEDISLGEYDDLFITIDGKNNIFAFLETLKIETQRELTAYFEEVSPHLSDKQKAIMLEYLKIKVQEE